MNDAVLPYLRCPNCWSPLAHAGAALRCPGGHSFDLARQGYVALLTGGRRHAGDSAAMVADRATFLAAGHYAFLADALASAASAARISAASAARISAASTAPPLVVDAGTGTGYYLARVLDALPGAAGLGVDVATAAVRRAARAHPRATAVLADLWRRLPLADGCAGLVLNVFAPRNGAEFRRILHPEGSLLVVTPAADHLAELVEAFGLLRVDEDKAKRVGAGLDAHFTATSSTPLRHSMRLSSAEVRTLIGMTPSARHMSPADLDPRPQTVTAAVALTVYRPL
jgi:23S rRNA (guanine745-N1)-methyltransferase